MKFSNYTGLGSDFTGGTNNKPVAAVTGGGGTSLIDSFEYADGWPGTVADINYYLTYTFTATNTEDESFEIVDGW